MPLTVVPQWLVDELGPALSGDENTGRVIAEQVMRTEQSDIVLEVAGEAKGTKVGGRAAALPPLTPGNTWDDVADKLRARVKAL